MKKFKVRVQTAKGVLSAPRSCKWLEMEADGLKITIDGCDTNHSVKITIETANKVAHMIQSIPPKKAFYI